MRSLRTWSQLKIPPSTGAHYGLPTSSFCYNPPNHSSRDDADMSQDLQRTQDDPRNRVPGPVRFRIGFRKTQAQNPEHQGNGAKNQAHTRNQAEDAAIICSKRHAVAIGNDVRDNIVGAVRRASAASPLSQIFNVLFQVVIVALWPSDRPFPRTFFLDVFIVGGHGLFSFGSKAVLELPNISQCRIK